MSQAHLYDKECKHSLDPPKAQNRVSAISYQICNLILHNQLLSCVIIHF
nr:MAG TPA: hypothetical protein [Caudoviricetes sp.]